MARFCVRCGAKLPLLQHWTGPDLCVSCRDKQQASHAHALAQYPAVLRDIWHGKISEAEGGKSLETLRVGLSYAEQREMHARAFRNFADEVLADDILTEVEEKRINAIAGLLGISQAEFESDFHDILFRLFIAKVNDGRLPIITDSGLVLRQGEKAHMDMRARLLKKVAVTEYQGAHMGVSFSIIKGVRYHLGGTSGRRVVVGSEIQEKDTGILVVTSHRVVFLGSSESMEMAYGKLLSMDVFDDGIRFHLSNRKNSPFFSLESGHVVAAAVNAAIQCLPMP